jgi:hypothetical protein
VLQEPGGARCWATNRMLSWSAELHIVSCVPLSHEATPDRWFRDLHPHQCAQPTTAAGQVAPPLEASRLREVPYDLLHQPIVQQVEVRDA